MSHDTRCWILTTLGAFVTLIPLQSAGIKQVLIGENFTMHCFDIPFDSEMFVRVVFTPSFLLNGSTIIGQHKPSEPERRSSLFTTTLNGDRLYFTADGSATVADVKVEDEGSYDCVESGFSVVEDGIKNEVLEVLIRPQIETYLLNSSLQAGDNLIEAVVCKVSNARPKANISWYSDPSLNFSETISFGESSYATNSTSVLSVVPTKSSNNQQVVCVVEQPAFENGTTYRTVNLKVQYSPSKPIIHINNETSQLRCTADGNPVPEITWQTPHGDAISNVSAGENIISADMESGVYVCIANNGISPSKRSDINITHPITPTTIKMGSAHAGVAVGIAVGCVLLVIIVGLVLCIILRKKTKARSSPPSRVTT